MDQATQFAEKLYELENPDDVVSQQVTIFGNTYALDATMKERDVLFGLFSETEIVITMLANDEEVITQSLAGESLYGEMALDGNKKPEAMADLIRKMTYNAHRGRVQAMMDMNR